MKATLIYETAIENILERALRKVPVGKLSKKDVPPKEKMLDFIPLDLLDRYIEVVCTKKERNAIEEITSLEAGKIQKIPKLTREEVDCAVAMKFYIETLPFWKEGHHLFKLIIPTKGGKVVTVPYTPFGEVRRGVFISGRRKYKLTKKALKEYTRYLPFAELFYETFAGLKPEAIPSLAHVDESAIPKLQRLAEGMFDDADRRIFELTSYSVLVEKLIRSEERDTFLVREFVAKVLEDENKLRRKAYEKLLNPPSINDPVVVSFILSSDRPLYTILDKKEKIKFVRLN